MKAKIVAVLGAQAVAGSVVSCAFWGGGNVLFGLSAALGVIVGIVPTIFYAWRISQPSELSPPRAFGYQVQGEIGKYMITVILFSIVFIFVKELEVVALFSSYISTLLVYWCALIKLNGKIFG